MFIAPCGRVNTHSLTIINRRTRQRDELNLGFFLTESHMKKFADLQTYCYLLLTYFDALIYRVPRKLCAGSCCNPYEQIGKDIWDAPLIQMKNYLHIYQPTIQNLSKILLFEKSESSISKAV